MKRRISLRVNGEGRAFDVEPWETLVETLRDHLKLTKTKETIVVKEVPVPAGPFVPNQKKREDLSITPRELEILELIAQGMSNREIAEKLYVSENTVKTHSSRVFDKLGARRRTQAVQMGKELGLLP